MHIVDRVKPCNICGAIMMPHRMLPIKRLCFHRWSLLGNTLLCPLDSREQAIEDRNKMF